MGNLKWADVAHYYKCTHVDGVFCDWWVKIPDPEIVYTLTPILRHLDDMPDERRLQVLESREWWAFERDNEQARLISRDDPRWNGRLVQWEAFRHGQWLYGQISLVNDHISNLVKYIGEGYDMFGLIESGEAIRKEVGNG